MFGCKKKKIEDKAAFKLGEKLAVAITDDLDRLLRSRYDPVFNNYLDVFNGFLLDAFDHVEAPPLVLARIHLEGFLENVSELRSKMEEEIRFYMEEWLETAKEVGVIDSVDMLIVSRINDFQTNLTAAGFKMLEGYMPALEDADSRWRTAKPELAARYSD